MIQRSSLALLCLMSVAIGAACTPMATSGGGTGSGSGSGSGSCRGDMGTTAAAARIEAFLMAAAEFDAAATDLQRDTLAACQRMGRSLGMSDAELQGSGTQGVQTVCNAVDQRFRAELAIVQSAQVDIHLVSQPPHCQVSVDAYARCAAECEANITPGQVEIQCEGGEIRGYCDAQCSGSCSVAVQGNCSGTCEGSCDGTCSATAANGSCAGQCNGTCHGECVVAAQASCQGECRGGCSVQYREPYCTGNIQPPQVSASCDASCDARVEAQAQCHPGQLSVETNATATAEQIEHITMVRNAVRGGLQDLFNLRTRARRLAQTGGEIARLAPGVPGAAVQVGAQAVSCATAAAASTARAMASVNVSVQVSVQVSGSVSASGG